MESTQTTADDQAHAESVKFLTTDVMKNFNQMSDDYSVSQSNLQAAQNQSTYQSQPSQVRQSSGSQRQLVTDEMSQDLQYLSREAPLDGGESTFGAATSYSQLHNHDEGSLIHMGSEVPEDRMASPPPIDQLAADNVELARRPMQQAGAETMTSQQADESQLAKLELKTFLVSFMVDARGGAMRGCRHSGVRVIIPPNSAQMPMRITCRYLRRERLVHPPPLMDGEACASKIMEVGPAGAKFLGPVLIEVPHFASLRNNEREIIILKSDTGEIWREHIVEADERLIESIIGSARESSQTRPVPDQENQAPVSDLEDSIALDSKQAADRRQLTRIITTEFPQYFAIISRFKQEVHAVGPQGTSVQSQTEPKVEAVFPAGALKKRIKIGLQDENKQHDGAKEQSAEAGSRPGSAQAKRRSRLLACFGTGQGSVDLSATMNDSDDTRQPCDEKPCEQRRILGDVDDSDAGNESPARQRHLQPTRAELVPEDYYIESEPPLILNVEPKTYGKRLASSAVQTDAQPDNERLSTSAKTPRKRRAGAGCVTCPGAGLGKRKGKAQMNILYDPKSTISRPKSALDSLLAADSSLETVSHEHQSTQEPQQLDQSSVILDMIQSDDLKWRTCTIQTDSDSVTVNYVTIAQDEVPAGDQKPSVAHAASGLDDGYVSGSGDINRQSSFGKGLFSLPFGSANAVDSSSQDKKKAKKQRKNKQRSKAEVDEPATAQQVDDSLIADSEPKSLVVESRNQEVESPDSLDSGPGDVSSAQRSVSPSAKELKQKRKQELKEKAKREKEQKSREEAANKAEKLRQKQEKEEAKKAERLAKKLADKSPSPPASESQQPPAQTVQAKDRGASVTFAKEVSSSEEAPPRHPELEQLDSIQRVIESTSTSYEAEKKRFSQEDGHDLIGVSISVDPSSGSAIAVSEEPGKELRDESQVEDLVERSTRGDQLVKSRPSIASGASVEITISEPKEKPETTTDELSSSLAKDESSAVSGSVQEPTGEQPATSSDAFPTKKQRAKMAKEERERMKREAKAMAKEEQRLAKEAKLAAKEVAKIKKKEKAEAKRAKTKDLKSSSPIPEVADQQQQVEQIEAITSSSEEPVVEPVEKEVKLEEEKQQSELKDSEKKSKKEKKKKKAKKGIEGDKAVAELPAASSEAQSSAAEPTSSSGEKSSFFGRLFKRRAAGDKLTSQVESKVNDSQAQENRDQQKKEPAAGDELILSEMYPRDPLDADGEMILEVNVPKELIEKKLNSELVVKDQPATAVAGQTLDWSMASDTPASPTQATTCDETLATSEVNDQPLESVCQQQHPDEERDAGAIDKRTSLASEKLDDQEATLVNVSQVFEPTSHNTDGLEDDEATENVLSQAIELPRAAVKDSDESSSLKKDDTKQELEEPVSEATVATSTEAVAKTIKSEKQLGELASEEAKRELEQKLDHELKKRTKEEEKRAKQEAKAEKLRLAKEQKLLAEEAKQKAKEEKKRLKREAEEAAAKAKEEKAKLKLEKKSKKKSKKDEEKAPVAGSSPKSDEVVDVDQMIRSGQDEQAKEPVTEPASEPLDLELEGMEPVNTETEVQRIVEESVDEDGMMTRTTRTIETKLVTLRHEEIKTQERRDVPIEEYEQELRRQDTNEEQQQQQQPCSSTQSQVCEELRQIIDTPSYFGPNFDPNLKDDGTRRSEKSLSPKKELKKRVKLNQKLIKKALRFAKSEAKVAKREANHAESEIANCDLAARQAQKQLKVALRESKRAAKAAAKDHKKMDKVDKKLAKRQKKIETKQRKLDKRAAKLAKKAAKERDQALAKEAKQEKKLEKKLKKSSSSSLNSAAGSGSKLQRAGSSGSKKSGLKLEDIGAPVLKSSSRLDIGHQQEDGNLECVAGTSSGIDEQQASEMVNKVDRQRSSLASADDLQVEMSVEQEHDIEQAISGAESSWRKRSGDQDEQQLVVETTTTGQSVQSEQQPNQVSSEQVAMQDSQQDLDGKVDSNKAANRDDDDGSSEIIDVVNDVPEGEKLAASS